MPGEYLGDAVLYLRTDGTAFVSGLQAARTKAMALGATFTQLGTRISAVGKSLTTKLTLPIALLGAGAVKMAADFDKSMSEIVGLVGVSREQVNAWRDDLLRLAPALGKAPKELADAMFFITSAGLRGETAMQTLVASTKAAVGGLGEVKDVADAATSAMNAYGAENLSAVEATDVLVATVREGKVAADELAGSIGKVIPTASAMGVEFNEVGAVLAGLTRIGFDAATSTTALRAIMNGLLKPTSEAEQVLRDMGTSAEQLRRQIKEEGLLSVLFELNDRFKGNTAELAKVFPNVRALSGVLGVLGDNADEVQGIMQRMADTTGDTQRAFEEAEQTITQKFARALANVKAALIRIGDVLAPVVLPAIEKMAQFISTAAERFANLNPETKRFVLIAIAAAAALGPALMVFGGLVKTLGLVSKAIGIVANPYVALAAATIGLTYLIVKNWNAIKDAAVRLHEDFSIIWGSILHIIDGAAQGIYNIVKGWLIDKFEWVSGKLQVAFAHIQNTFIKARNLIASIFGGEQKDLINIDALKAELAAVAGAGDKLIEEGRRLMQTALEEGKAGIKYAAGDIADLGEEIYDGIAEKVNAAFEKVKGVLGLFGPGEGPTGLLEQLEAVQAEALEAINGVTTAVDTQHEAFLAMDHEMARFGELTEEAKENQFNLKESFEALIKTGREWSDFLATTLVDAYGASFEAVGQAIVDAKSGWEALKEAAKSAISGILRALGKEWAARALAALAALRFRAAVLWGSASAAAFIGAGYVKSLATGGMVYEPVIGTGLETGQTYTIAERQPEYVGPPGSQGGGDFRITQPFVIAIDAKQIYRGLLQATRNGIAMVHERGIVTG